MTKWELHQQSIMLARIYSEIGDDSKATKLLNCCPDRPCRVRCCPYCEASNAVKQRGKSFAGHRRILEYHPGAHVQFITLTVRDVTLHETGETISRLKAATSHVIRQHDTLGNVQSVHIARSTQSDGHLHIHTHVNVWTPANQWLDSEIYWSNAWTDSVRQSSARLCAQELQVQPPMSGDEIEIKLRYTFSREPFLEVFQSEETARIVLPQLQRKQLVHRGGMASVNYASTHTPDFLIS
jgi:hypothetical protein